MIDIKLLVQEGRVAEFVCYSNSCFYYSIEGYDRQGNKFLYEFPIPIDELQGVSIYKEEKPANLMRWIRKSINDKTLRTVIGPIA